MRRFIAALVLATLTGCSQPKAQKEAPPPPPPPPPQTQPAEQPKPPPAASPEPAPREAFPFIRVDPVARLVEIDGIVPIDCHDPATPRVFLELVACTPDTREHEVLMVTKARPSNVHAALLAIGLTPGVPGSWTYENKRVLPVPPRGDGVEVRIAYRDKAGTEIECPVTDWIVNAETGAAFRPRRAAAPQWVFAGSVFATRQGHEVYDADGAGTLVGLCTFGSEVISWCDTISPEASIEEPVWIADIKKVPAAGTPVVLRVRPARP